MTKTMQVETLDKKNDIISYLSTGTYPTGMTKNEKTVLKRQSSKFEFINGNLHLIGSPSTKLFICAFEEMRINEIIKTYHERDHIGSRSTHERISEHYDGITFVMVKEYVTNCNSCRIQFHLKELTR